VGAVGELAEVRAVGGDFVEMEVFGVGLAPGEEDLPGVVVDLGIADASPRVVEKDGQFAGAEVEEAETAAGAVEFVGRVLDVAAEIFVPVAANAGLPCGENDLLKAGVACVELALQNFRYRKRTETV